MLLACKSNSKASASSQTKQSFDAIVRQKLGNEFDKTWNTSETIVLCQQKRTGDHAARKFKYIVIRKSDNAILTEGTFQMGSVKWYDDDSIEILSSSALSGDDAGTRKIVDVNLAKQ